MLTIGAMILATNEPVERQLFEDSGAEVGVEVALAKRLSTEYQLERQPSIQLEHRPLT